MGLLIEKYIGKTGKKLFLLFCWLFTLIVIAAFADMVAGTFNAYETVDGVTKLSAQATVNGAAGSISCYLSLLLLSSDCSRKNCSGKAGKKWYSALPALLQPLQSA